MPELIPAQIELDNGTPYSPAFADCYFSRQGGLAETRYVFLQGNALPQRWQGKAQFTIAETGFGTGLNFLATWQAWQTDPQHCRRLHYIAIEKHPIPLDKLRQVLAQWGELQPYANALLQNYPPLLHGFHRISLANGQLTLTLCFMDVQEALAELVARVDAWYLDGFAPARNPEMWALPVLQSIAARSSTGATLATFTAASDVRRHLQTAGFAVQKRKGFASKREMLSATLPQATNGVQLPPWFALPVATAERNATVVGGGVAGCQIAYALAQRGWQVTLLERHARLAMEASGNRAGAVTPKMTAALGWGEVFYRQAFGYALRQLRQLQAAGHELDWAQCGALQLAHEPREAARQQALQARGLPADFIQLVDAAQAAALAGIALPTGASYFPQAAWLNPASLCAALSQHPNIRVRTLHTVATLPESGLTVIASGREADRFPQSAFLPFVPVLGQTTSALATPQSSRLQTVLGHEGYLTPAVAGQHIFGATFVRNVREAVLAPTADRANFTQLRQYLPEFAANVGEISSSHAAVRMTTPDRYPVVGLLPDVDFVQKQYADIRHGRAGQAFPALHYQRGMAIMAGFGSRGLTTSGLCAELLAAILHAEPLPLQATLYGYLHPARFLLRQLRRA